MTVIKNQKSNTYEVRTYYKDWTGVRKQKTKRGFKRKCDAQEWERAFKLKENLSLDMYFADFVDLYLNDIKSRKNTDPNRTHWNVEYCNEDIKDVSAICRRYVRILEKLLDQDDEFKLKYNNIRDEKTNLTCDI